MSEMEQGVPKEPEIQEFLKNVKQVFMVMSGKGGVGKSTMAAGIAASFAAKGLKTGLMDIDVHGPSIARIMGLTGMPLNTMDGKIQPYAHSENLKIISMQGFLQNQDDAVIWRGPLKIGVIKQFMTDVDWGALDVLVIDSPPGTGDEPLTVAQFIPDCGAIVVTTPQGVALADVRKSLNFCRQVGMEVVGIIENMSGYVCPQCGHHADIFKSGGGEALALEFNVPFLGRMPIDPSVVAAGDDGASALERSGAMKAAMTQIVENILSGAAETKGEITMEKIAVPVVGGMLSSHFGHCEEFMFATVENGKVTKIENLVPPPHEPGVIPNWLAQQGATVVLVGGMGERAQEILQSRGVAVLCGVQPDQPLEIVNRYLERNLTVGGNSCNHDGDEDHHCGH
jgi:Mrp family chromosome partitioning ATPase/predicted Fe-Mo cluster-binding NifX family protein